MSFKLLRTGRAALVAAAICVAMSAAADGLPEGYARLPYIKANKNVQVKTGYTPNATDKIVMTWCPSQADSIETLWCARSGLTAYSFTVFAYAGRQIGINYNNVSLGDGAVPASFTVNRRDNLAAYTKYTIVADGNAKTLAVTNAFTGAEVVNISWTVANDFTAGSQLCLFASHKSSAATANGNYSSHFLYSFKVYDAAGNLKLDLVPAKDASGVVGLYDAVGDSGTTGERFKTMSNGTGSLSDTLIDKTFDDDFTLLGDEVFGTVTVATNKTLNLNGHSLTVGGLAGDGTISAGLRDLTSPDPDGERVTWTSKTGSLTSNTTGANLFNDNYARVVDSEHRAIASTAQLPFSVTYDFGADTPQKVDLYKIYCGAWEGNQVRGPKAWTLEGSNDGDGWTPIDSRDDETWDNTHEARTYAFANSTAYRYYRITFTESRGSYLELVQLEYFDSSLGNAAQGELHVAVPQGAEVTNATVSIHGNVKLVKEGKGTFVGNRPSQAYHGGTLVSEGTLKAMPGVRLPFGEGGADIQVDPDAAYDFNGSNTSYIYHFKMNGGNLENTGAHMTASQAQVGAMTFMADSRMVSPSALGFRGVNDSTVNVDLAWHTLSVTNGDVAWFTAVTFLNGVVRVVANVGIAFHNGGHADTATFDLKGPVAIYEADVTVSNLVLRSGSISSTSADAKYAFKVSGTFKTETDDFPFVTMMDGSTLDLTDREGAFNAVSASSNVNGYRLRFDPGATVTIDVSGRTPATGECLVAWDEVPQNVTFQFDAATAAGGVLPVVAERGLLYGHDDGVVEQAWWTGAANDGNVANPANWLCKNVAGGTVTGASALPSAVTHVYIEGTLATNVQSLACRICTLTNAALAADCDLRGLGAALEIAPEATINLNGHKLYVAASAQVGVCTVSDAVPVDLTSPDTTPSRVTSTGDFYGDTVGANLFNDNYERQGDETHRIIAATNALPVSVAYDFGEPTVVDAYRIWTGPIKRHSSRLPMQWKVEGSNDGVDWALLDYRKGVSGYGEGNGSRVYSFDNETAYRRYRITLEAAQVNNNGYLEMVQLEYYRLKPTQGELHIDTTGVSDAVEYSGLSLAGNMRLVKEGAGTIRLSKEYQTNLGGLEVQGGTVIPGTSSATSIATKSHFGVLGVNVIVRGNNTGEADAENGVVDFGATSGYTSYRFVLDGGAVYNPGLANLTDIRLDSDSWLKLTDVTPKNGTNYIGRADSPSFVDLRGHTLSSYIESGGRTLYLYNVTVDDGEVDVVSGGWFGSRGTVVATNNVSFTVNCACDIQSTFAATDCIYRQSNTGYNRGEGVVDVFGRFGMLVRVFHGTRLHDGAMIDFTELDDGIPFPLPTVAMFATSQTGDKTLRFEPGATIGVKLGERKLEKGTQVISWDAATAPDATVKFKSADAERKYRLKKEADGLYYYPPAGFTLIVR